jgi:hypothetical protein
MYVVDFCERDEGITVSNFESVRSLPQAGYKYIFPIYALSHTEELK